MEWTLDSKMTSLMDNNVFSFYGFIFLVAEELIVKDFFKGSTGTASMIAFGFCRVWVLVKL